MLWITTILTAILLLIGSITDLKKREVYDYVSYGLVVIGFAAGIIYSFITGSINPFANSLLGFLLGLMIAYAMFYMGQWGGGDSKLIMGLGAVIGFNIFPAFGPKNYWFIILIICILFIGAIYGLIWSVYLAIKKRKLFVKRAKEWSEKKDMIMYRRIMLAFIFIACVATLIWIPNELKLLVLSFIVMLFVIFYMWIFVRVIEESCMIKRIPVSKLTEGDWIYKNIYAGKKYISGPKDLGISREKIKLLKKYKIKFALVKEGIPFIPVFFLAYIATILLYHFNVFIPVIELF
jgi:Flp pilus assembly protein protease CpaA